MSSNESHSDATATYTPPKKSYKLWAARGYRWPYWFREYLKPKNYLYSLQHCRGRLVRGYSDRDVFDYYTYLAEIIYLGLENFCPNGSAHSIPMLDGYNWDGTMTAEDHTAAEAEWCGIINDMREGFASFLDEDIFVPSAEVIAKRDRAMDLFKEYFTSLWL